MGVKITDKLTPEGRRFMQTLKELGDLEVRIGYQHGEATEDDGTDICDIAAWNELGTVTAPSRPFMRQSVDNNEAQINGFLQTQKQRLLAGESAQQVLNSIGIFQKALIQKTIVDGSFVPNAQATIVAKDSDRPLIDSGRMRQSVNYVIKRKGERTD